MRRAKLARKSTSIDMTAMCDVAFLLLSYFIIVAHFKKPEKIEITTPGSVSTKLLEDKNIVMITMDKGGRVFFSVSDANTSQKADIIDKINLSRNLGLTDGEKANFSKMQGAYIAVPFSQLKSYLQHPPAQLKDASYTGIPVTDSLHNELTEWIAASVSAFANSKMNILVNGDNAARYPSFGGILLALKKNNENKFNLVTTPASAPPGSELAQTQARTGNKKVE
ncbi:MAG: biopolymer transporter ExbD [Puia sp.]|nr:biopolymer transporter ExbD [Puia sp.]